MSYARAKRRYMKWERMHQRHPRSGAIWISGERYHYGHIKAHSQCVHIGRGFNAGGNYHGVRDAPWSLPTLRDVVAR
jgi:hypothetical protein